MWAPISLSDVHGDDGGSLCCDSILERSTKLGSLAEGWESLCYDSVLKRSPW